MNGNDDRDIKDKEITFRNRFLCRSCKKLYISKDSLDNHIILCYESRLEKIKEEHKKDLEKINKEYEDIINDILDYMMKHVDSIEKKHITLNNYLIKQIKTLSSL